MRRPIRDRLPRLDQVAVGWRGRTFSLPYFYREGTGGPAVMFVHGLGGAKENFSAAYQSPALAGCTLLAFDLPGTGLAEFVLHDHPEQVGLVRRSAVVAVVRGLDGDGS